MLLETKKLDSAFEKFLTQQSEIEKKLCKSRKKLNGVFCTNNERILDLVLSSISYNSSFFNKKFLEPSCGQGAFLIKLILRAYILAPDAKVIQGFIEKNLFFIDINPEILEIARENISNFYFYLFNKKYTGKFNSYCRDFTKVKENSLFCEKDEFFQLYGNFDYVLGNPPYISLYGRRDKKKNEEQRNYFLKNYNQFPRTLKNGKINYIMLFIEHGMKFLKERGRLSFIIDISFFETAYQYCREMLVKDYTIISLLYNLKSFEDVTSGQLILDILNKKPNKNKVRVCDVQASIKSFIEQNRWNNSRDEFKFRISHCNKSDRIIESIFNKKDPTLREMYPKKNLRTCTMLLNMEEIFTGEESRHQNSVIKSYPYYRGSNGLKSKYSKLYHDKYFYYDKVLQDTINDELKEQLTLKGIKNKKRVGLGEIAIYDNPKIYIRQSAKELIASLDNFPSAANNSLYVFSLRDDSEESIKFLKYLCGLLNSTLYTFFAQQRRIIRYNRGKQPQIKIADLYQIFIPQDQKLKNTIISLVDKIYQSPSIAEKFKIEIDELLYKYYELTNNQRQTIIESIGSFFQ